MSRGLRSISVTLVMAALGLVIFTGCGRKGPPLPPLPSEKGVMLYKTSPDEARGISLRHAQEQSVKKEIS